MTLRSKAKIRALVQDRKSFYNTAELESLSIPPLFGIETDPDFLKAKKVALYWSLPDEVYTHQFIEKWKSTKDIYLPHTENETMTFIRYEGLSELKEGAYHVFEPCGQEKINPEHLDLIIVPGVAFDEQGNRVGRGKGYYDSYLCQTKATKIGLAFPFQMFDEVPSEAHDQIVNKVIF